ncbi:MAG TPA: hypothetical protein VHY79_19290 [Rhizomicrobium sp.]|nr:hypothetical protein [Rhizomicrobium sp.]
MNRYGLFLLLVGAAILDGCGTAPPEAPRVGGGVETQPALPDELHCRAVARARADDALANGYGFEIDARLYREAYDECMEWRAHNKSNSPEMDRTN